jgi:Icc-related predicted phosphoesterase
MELLETQDPERTRLLETSDHHKRAMEKELSEMTKKTDKMLMNALIIGGSLAATYFIISTLSSKRKKKKKKIAQALAAAGEGPVQAVEEEEDDEPTLLSKVGTRLIDQATLILLELAKQKLAEYMASRNKPDDHS